MMAVASPGHPPYDTRRLGHIARAGEMAGPLLAQIEWPPERLVSHRREQLRRLIRHAQQSSPWHARRLAGLDPATVTETDLDRVPPMTKVDLMMHWDEIVTDPRLSLARCEAHLQGLDSSGAVEYLANEFHVLASGGSSGRRGVFVFGWDEFAIFYLALTRWALRGLRLQGHGAAGLERVASVTASAPTHATRAVGRTFALPGQELRSFPVHLPLAEIVSGLNRLQPSLLNAYTSALNLLAHEALAGRLQIRPRWLWVTSEPLLPEIADLAERAWGIAPVNGYGTTDVGMMGSGCGVAPGVHLNEDLLIVDPVDAAGRSVGPGTRSAKAYVTALTHYTLPVIRYELDDEITLLDEPCPCGSHLRRIADPQGRMDDVFRYGDLVIHPHVFRSPLSRSRHLLEYQVRQTPAGAHVDLVTDGPVDECTLRATITRSLEDLGLPRPVVSLRVVDSIPRVGIGKLKRFVPRSF